MKFRLGWKLFAFVLFIALLGACNSSEAGPEVALAQAIEYLRAGDIEAFGELTTNDVDFSLDAMGIDGDSEAGLQLLRALVHHLNIDVLEQEVRGNDAILQLRVSNVASNAVVNDFLTFGTMMMYSMMGEAGEEQMLRDLAERIRLDNAPILTEEVELRLIRAGNEWLLVAPERMEDDPPPFWIMLFGLRG